MVSHSNTQFRDQNLNQQRENGEKRNMRVSNIILGNENKLGVSENMEQFHSKQKTQNVPLDKTGLRMHSHNFGGHQQDYKSINSIYMGDKLKDLQKNDPNKAKENIRQSNINLGFHNVPIERPQDQKYRIQGNDSNMSDLRLHNFELGIDERKIPMEGYNNLVYNKEKELNYVNNSKEVMLE